MHQYRCVYQREIGGLPVGLMLLSSWLVPLHAMLSQKKLSQKGWSEKVESEKVESEKVESEKSPQAVFKHASNLFYVYHKIPHAFHNSEGWLRCDNFSEN